MTATYDFTPARQGVLAGTWSKARARTEAKVEDLVFLLDHGTDVEHACARVGWTVGAAAQALRRRDHRYAPTVGNVARELRKVAQR